MDPGDTTHGGHVRRSWSALSVSFGCEWLPSLQAVGNMANCQDCYSQGSPQSESVLEQLLPTSEFAVCRGTPDYSQQYEQHIRYKPQGLHIVSVGDQHICHESERCLLWHKSKRTSFLDRCHYMWPECKSLDSHNRQDAKRTAAVSSSVRIARTLPSSTYPISHLSPASQKTCTRRLIRECKHLAEQLSKYSSMCISLDH